VWCLRFVTLQTIKYLNSFMNCLWRFWLNRFFGITTERNEKAYLEHQWHYFLTWVHSISHFESYLDGKEEQSARGWSKLHNKELNMLYSAYNESRDSSVGIALGYGLDDRGSMVWFLAGAGNLSLHHHVQNGSGAHPASYQMGNRGSFPGGKAAGEWRWPLTSI
jgi:hypothetical protein